MNQQPSKIRTCKDTILKILKMTMLLIHAWFLSNSSNNIHVSPANGNISHDYVNYFYQDVPPIVIHSLWFHFPFIVATNVLVITTVFYIRELHTASNMLIAGLAIVDLLTGVVTLPIVWMINNPDLDISILILGTKAGCVFAQNGYLFFTQVALKYIFLMSVERFFAIKFPIKYRVSSNLKKVAILMVCVFFVDVIQVVIVILVFLHQDVWKDGLSKLENAKQCLSSAIISRAYLFFLFGLTICLIISSLCLNLSVGCFAWKQIKARYKPFTSLTSKQFKKRHTQAYHEIQVKKSQLAQLKISLSLMCIFVILWLPYITNTFYSFAPEMNPKTYDRMISFAHHSLLTNAWINAFVYAFLKKTYRTAYFFFLTHLPWNWSKVNAFLNRGLNTTANFDTPNSKKSCSSTIVKNNTDPGSLHLNRNLQYEEELSERDDDISDKLKLEKDTSISGQAKLEEEGGINSKVKYEYSQKARGSFLRRGSRDSTIINNLS